MKETSKTKVCYSESQADGKTKQYITSETAWNKIVKEATDAQTEAEKAGTTAEPAPTLVAMQTFGYKLAESVDEAVGLAGGSGLGEYENIDVFLGVFNYAASLRQDNEANDILQGESFAPKDGVWDVSYAVAQKVERAKMTPQEQALKALAKGGIVISAEQLQEALALIQQQAASQASA
jgi:hypothetical protein